MPVYKLSLPVIAFSSNQPLPALRSHPAGVLIQTSTPAQSSRAEDGQTQPSEGKPFG